MKFGSIYSEVSGRQERFDNNQPKKEVISPAEQATITQTKVDWIQHPITTEMFRDINETIAGHLQQAVQLAVTFPQHKDFAQIINVLVKVDTLQNLIKVYGRLKSS